MRLVQDLLRSGKVLKDVVPIVTPVCLWVLNESKKKGDVMCPGLIDEYGPVVSTVHY